MRANSPASPEGRTEATQHADTARLKRVVAQYLWERIPTHDALQCDLWADGILALVAEHNDGDPRG